jgi:cellulose synthase operon protein C
MTLHKVLCVLKRRTITALALAGVVLLGMGTSPAVEQPGSSTRGEAVEEPQEQRPQGLNPDSFYGRDSGEGVYVRDSAIALEKFAHGQRMERQREWHTAADIYQEILEQYPDRVVPSQVDAENRIYQYTSVIYAVQEQLSRWPVEGLNVYRGRFEPQAQGMLEQAGRDFARLHEVFSRYFVTESGKTAGLRLVDLHLLEGEFAAAAWLGDRLTMLHPTIEEQRATVLYRTAIAYHLSGNGTEAHRRLEDLRRRHGQASGTVAGQEVVLAESLEQELAKDQPIAHGQDPGSWPMFHGSLDRGRISAAMGRPGARLPTIELAGPSWRGMNPQTRAALETELADDQRTGMTLGIMPVLDHGELFFQDNSRIYAVSLDSGLPLPGWAQTHRERNGQYTTGSWPTPRGRQLTLTVTEASVLAVMGQTDWAAMQRGQPPGETRLVCLDRRTGEERWTISPRQLPEGAGNLRALSFSGSPVVVGEMVYLIGRGGTGGQFEDCYVLAFDLANGALQWSCYIASANTTTNPRFGIDPSMTADNVSHLAYSSGRLYVQTNLGALAAVDAYSGSVVWLSIYPREAMDMQNMRFGGGFRGQRAMSQMLAKPWTPNPAIVQDGRVFILPTDGRHVLVYDAGSGIEIKRLSRSHVDNADTLLAVTGEKLIVAADQRVFCLNWNEYDEALFERNDRSALVWATSQLPQIRGRGFVTTDSVFVPTEERLSRVELSSGITRETYPNYPNRWSEGEGPGNVVVAREHVILAGAGRVDVYTDLQLARAKLEEEIAAAGNDPEPRLRYAEVMFVAGEHRDALTRLDEAIALLGGDVGPRPGTSRDRIFNSAMMFAQKLAGQPRPETMELTAAFFERAGTAARSPAQQVSYRINRAHFARQVRDFTTEVALYQQILSDPALRAVPLADEQGVATTVAAAAAEQAIDERIRAMGRRVYEPFERSAKEAVAQALEANDPQRLLLVAQEYPNAEVAFEAMVAAAEAHESVGDQRAATQVLRQIHFRFPDHPQRGGVLESLARNYLAMPNRLEAAIARLAQAERLPNGGKLQKPLVLPDGRVLEDVTVSEALSVLRQMRLEAAARSLPELGLPVPKDRAVTPGFESPAAVAEGVEALVIPMRTAARNDRVVTWSGGRLSVWDGRQAQVKAEVEVLSEPPIGAAWLNDVPDDLIVWSAAAVARVNTDDGSVAWRLVVGDMPEVAVPLAGDVPAQQADEAAAEAGGERERVIIRLGAGRQEVIEEQIIIRENQRLIIQGNVVIHGGMGNMVMRPGMAPGELLPAVPAAAQGVEQIAQVVPVDERLLIGSSHGRLACVDLRDGSVAWQMGAIPDRPIERILANDEFTVLRTADEATVQLVVLDTYSGQVISRQPFATETGRVPINVALSDVGMLVYTLPGQICGRNLFEPGTEPQFEEPREGTSLLFAGMHHPEQLLVSEGRILAASDGGQFVRVHSLETGRQLRPMLQTGATGLDVRLRLVGPQLYIIGQQSLMAYNLEHPERKYPQPRKFMDPPSKVVDAFVGVNYLLLVDEPGERAEGEQRVAEQFLLRAVARYPVSETNPEESGRIDYLQEIESPSGVKEWQAVDGGVYFLSRDGRLQFLRGTGG